MWSPPNTSRQNHGGTRTFRRATRARFEAPPRANSQYGNTRAVGPAPASNPQYGTSRAAKVPHRRDSQFGNIPRGEARLPRPAMLRFGQIKGDIRTYQKRPRCFCAAKSGWNQDVPKRPNDRSQSNRIPDIPKAPRLKPIRPGQTHEPIRALIPAARDPYGASGLRGFRKGLEG